jgi:hypothetical protein
MTPAVKFATGTPGIIHTCGKFATSSQQHWRQICRRCQPQQWQIATGINDADGKFATGVNNTGGKYRTAEC